MTTKKFTIGGYSKLGNGQYKARFANTSVKARTALLERSGHSEVTLVDLPSPMTKVEAARYLLDTFQNLVPAAGVALQHVLNGADSDEVETIVKPVTTSRTKAKVAA